MSGKITGSKKRCQWCGNPTPRKIHPCGKTSYANTCQSAECNVKTEEHRKKRISEVLTGNREHYDRLRKHFSAKCVVCGREYSIRHDETKLSRPRTTCSDECLKEFQRTRNSCRIKNHAEIETEQQRFNRTGKMFNREQTASATAMGEGNVNSRAFLLIAPDGERFEGRNVSHFVRTHSHLFTADELELSKPIEKLHGISACEGTRQPICCSRLTAVLRGVKGSYHGWTGFYTDKN